MAFQKGNPNPSDFFVKVKGPETGVLDVELSGGVSVSPKVSLKNMLVITGRVVADTSHVVGRASNGMHYTMAFVRDGNGQMYQCRKNSKLFDIAAHTEVVLPDYSQAPLESRWKIELPTLVNNSEEQPRYYQLMGFDRIADKLANLTRGSQIIVIGDYSNQVFCGKELEVVVVMQMYVVPKGRTAE